MVNDREYEDAAVRGAEGAAKGLSLIHISVIMLRMALTIPAAIGSEVFITYIGLGLSVEVPSLGNLCLLYTSRCV